MERRLTALAVLALILAAGGCAQDRALPEPPTFLEGGDAGSFGDVPDPDDTAVDAPSTEPSPDTGRPDVPNSGSALCMEYCSYIQSCMEPLCGGPVGYSRIYPRAECVAECDGDPSYVDYIPDALEVPCVEFQIAFCEQSTAFEAACACDQIERNETNAGAPCATDAQCEGGALEAFCIPQEEGGYETGFVGGYCSTESCASAADCGEDGICLQLEEDWFGCLAWCEDRGDCRAGYACWPLSEEGWGFCYPACGEAVICGEGSVCLSGVCADPPRCDDAGRCPSPLLCFDGYCEALECGSNEECPFGAVCAGGVCN